MKTDTEIRIKGMEVLIEKLGEIEAERFISLIIKEPFDYTKWQRKLFKNKSIKEISKEAMKLREKGNLV